MTRNLPWGLMLGLLFTLGAGTIVPTRGDDKDGFRPLFNGKNLDGWVASRSELWSVAEGQIVGKVENGQIKSNTFLATRDRFSDFVLKASARLVDEQGNSGIQFRSEMLPDGRAKGYQADMAKGYWGLLYHEAGRGILKQPDPEAVKKAGFVHENGWNQYVITAKGHHITLELNGIKAVDLDDPDGELSGVIALQLHAGYTMEVRFKDIAIRELK